MINGIYLSTMGAMTQSSRHGVIANNLANSSTTGFKPNVASFRELLAESAMQPGGRFEVDKLMEKTGGGAWLNAIDTAWEPGPLMPTGNGLNAAVADRNGFFTVERDGETYYTRDGAFVMNSLGQLTLNDGVTRVLDEAGQAVAVSGAPRIMSDGRVVDEETGDVLAVLGLVRADDPQKTVKVGDNLFRAGDATMTAGGVRLQEASLEQSAVEPISEMTGMIEAARMYQANMSFIRMQDETLGQTVSRVGRTG